MARRLLAVATASLLLAAGVVPGASAAPTEGYADWTLGGGPGAYTATATDLATGFPTVSLTSNSRGQAAVVGGTSTWVPGSSSFGAAFGSSQNREYLSLRPAADSAASPSATTLTFADPTPVGGWGLALGDVDAEVLEVTGTDADGDPLTGAELGLVEAFSSCDASPRASSCTGTSAPYAVPTTTVQADRVRLEDTGCPDDVTRCDTSGASAWLAPTVPVGSITVRSTWKQGSPTFNLWLATAESAVAGTVSAQCSGDAGGATIDVLGADDAVVATTTTGADGTWRIGSLLALTDWRLRLTPPAGAAVDGDDSTVVDLSDGDVEGLDTALTALRPVSGTVTDEGGDPVAGASVTLTAGTSSVGPVTTGSDGTWTLTDVPAGGWDVVVTPPSGFLTPDPEEVTVGCAAVTAPTVVLEASASATPTTTPTATTTGAPTTTAAPTTGAPTASGEPTTTPTSAPTSTTGPGGLAGTGADLQDLAGAALVLLAAGGALVLWSSHRAATRRH